MSGVLVSLVRRWACASMHVATDTGWHPVGGFSNVDVVADSLVMLALLPECRPPCPSESLLSHSVTSFRVLDQMNPMMVVSLQPP